MTTGKDIEFDGDNDRHCAAYDKAFEKGREEAAEKFDASEIEADWGYETTVPVELTYRMGDVESTISRDIDISDYYDDPKDIIGSPGDMDDDITNELREDWEESYATKYADEHWTEFLEDEETPEEKAYREISAKWDELDKSKSMLWDVITNVVECKELRSIPRESKILIQSAYELIYTARDCIASELRKVEEERAEAERQLNASKAQPAEESVDGPHETQDRSEETQEAKEE